MARTKKTAKKQKDNSEEGRAMRGEKSDGGMDLATFPGKDTDTAAAKDALSILEGKGKCFQTFHLLGSISLVDLSSLVTTRCRLRNDFVPIQVRVLRQVKVRTRCQTARRRVEQQRGPGQ